MKALKLLLSLLKQQLKLTERFLALPLHLTKSKGYVTWGRGCWKQSAFLNVLHVDFERMLKVHTLLRGCLQNCLHVPDYKTGAGTRSPQLDAEVPSGDVGILGCLLVRVLPPHTYNTGA